MRLTIAGLMILAWPLVFFAAASGRSSVPDEGRLAAVVKAVTARQQGVRSCRFTWTARTLAPKASMPLGVYPEATTSDLPLEDTSLEEQYSVLLDGQKLRHDRKGWGWNLSFGRFQRETTSQAYVEGVARSLDNTTGMVTPRLDDVHPVEVSPILDEFRMLDPVLGEAKSQRLRLIGEAEFGGHRCALVEWRDERGEPPLIDDWWLAEDLDYSIVQWQYKAGDERLLVQVGDMKYVKDPEVGWRPKSWTLTKFVPVSGIPQTTRCEVTEAVFNQEVLADAFDIVFPPGTRVGNHFGGADYVVGDVAEHSASPPRPAQLHPPSAGSAAPERVREQAGPPGPTGRTPAPARKGPLSTWLLVGGGALVLLIVLAIVLARRRTA